MLRRAGAGATLILLLVPLLMACSQLLHGQMLVWGDALFPGYAGVRAAYAAEERAAAEAAEDHKPVAPAADGESLDDIFGDADPATAAKSGAQAAKAGATAAGEPGETEETEGDGLDALIDEAEGAAKPAPEAGAAKEQGGDALDALIDEAEEPEAAPKPEAAKEQGGDALDALIDEAEAPEAAKQPAPANKADAAVAAKAAGGDDLDALIDEAEGGAAVGGAAAATKAGGGPGDHPDDAGLLDDLDKPDAPSARPAAPVAKIVLTDNQRTYCKIERGISDLGQLGVTYMPLTMALLLLLAAIIATSRRHHISLRSPVTVLEDRVSNIAQIIGNLMAALSAYHMLEFTEGHNHELHQLWLTGLLAMSAVNVLHLVKPITPKPEVGFNIGKVVATIPLYTFMAIISGLYFFLAEDHPTGMAIYLQKLSEFSILYVQVGLYLWTGMLLRDTSLGQLFFDLVRPLRPPPEVFAVLVVVIAAVPTAYSGASGILVLALGATIFTELRRAGAGQQRALAATAMSGSLGVVLPPCLLVVIVASLNLDVTTDELFHWGWRVFGLTTMIFVLVSFVFRKHPWTLSPDSDAGSQMRDALGRLAPYFGLGVAVVVLFAVVFDAGLDEHTAPYVLPVAMMAIIPWDRRRLRLAKASGEGPADDDGGKRETMLDTGTHIGALLMLMGLSACLGGVIERSEIIELFPHHLGSPYAAMAVLMFVLVIIGMVMDPYGAVILVSVTLYPIAKDNGIHPLNFWMTALVSFELGYLTPPVALNHLLTRQVVQGLPDFEEEEVVDPNAPFWRRHERVVLPIAVLATTLLIVAFGPILMGAGSAVGN